MAAGRASAVVMPGSTCSWHGVPRPSPRLSGRWVRSPVVGLHTWCATVARAGQRPGCTGSGLPRAQPPIKQPDGLPALRAGSVAETERIGDLSSVGGPVWPDFGSRYDLGRFLGRGSFVTVNLAVDKVTGEQFAAKCIPKQREGTNAPHILQKILLEVDMLQSLQNCPQAIGFEGVFQDEDHVYVVTEVCHGRDLETLLRTHGPMREQDAAKAVFDILHVLAECHRQGICYNDVKPANFLLKQPFTPGASHLDLEVKVVDFGCSQRVVDGGKLAKRTGTPVYMAPELFMRYYGIESDLWGLGMMCYQLLSGKLPFWESMQDRNPFSIMSAILNAEVSFEGPTWDGVSPEAVNLIQRLLDRDYNSRITASEALQHVWFAEQCASKEQEGCVVVNNVVKLKQSLSALKSHPAQDT